MDKAKALHGLRILVTRPAPQGQALVHLLQQHGAQPTWLPLLQIEALSEQDSAYQAAKQALLNLDYYQVVICTSRPAARLAIALIDQYWPQLPIGIRWLAVGAGTAAELAEYGIEAETGADGEDSEALLRHPALQQLQHGKVLLLKGEGGRTLLAEQLQTAGVEVCQAILYRRQPCPAPAHFAQLLADTQVVLLSSGEALHHFHQLCGGPRPLPLVVPSQRVAELAQHQGWPTILISAGAQDHAMLDCLTRWRQGAPCQQDGCSHD